LYANIISQVKDFIHLLLGEFLLNYYYRSLGRLLRDYLLLRYGRALMLRQPDPQLSNIALSPHTTVGGHINTVTINTNTPYTPNTLNTIIEEGQRSHVDTVVDFEVYGSMASKLADGAAEISR
jgi:hypothetical protein